MEPLKPREEDSGLKERHGGENDEQCPKLLKGQVKVFPLSHGEEVALTLGVHTEQQWKRGLADAELSAASSQEKHLPPSALAFPEGER